MGAGFCSLYHEIHYIEVHYIKVWAYIENLQGGPLHYHVLKKSHLKPNMAIIRL